MGGKGSSPPAPDYTPVAAANEAAARIAAEVSREQLAWAKETYAQDREVTNRYIDLMLPAMEAESKAGADSRARYESVFQPMEDQLVREATDYASPARMEFEAGRAQADVAQAFESQRKASLASLESYGVDPSMARAGALDKAARTIQAATAAGAANAARLQTENVGRALRGEAINVGKGYPGNIAQAYQTAQQSGGSAVQSNLATTASGASTMGTGVQWSGQQQGFLQNWGQNLNAQQQAYDAAQQRNSSSAGGLIGGVLGLVGAVAGPFTGGLGYALANAGPAAASALTKKGS